MELVSSNGGDLPNMLATLNDNVQSLPASASNSLSLINNEIKPKEEHFPMTTQTPVIITHNALNISLNNAHTSPLSESLLDDISVAAAASALQTVNKLNSGCGTVLSSSSQVSSPNDQNDSTEMKSIPLKEDSRPEISSSMLQANEQMISEDEDDEMDTQSEHDYPIPQTVHNQLNVSKDSLIPESPIESHGASPYPGSDSELTTSGIVCSSFNTDSFRFGSSSRECSESVSPDKPVGYFKSILPTSVPSGIASFTSACVKIPDNAISAPLDMSSHNFPKRHRHVHRAAVYAMHPYHRATCRGGTGVNVAKTLDLLKAVMQSSFNQEVKKLCDDYYKIYGVAAGNVHDNTGDSVPPSTLRLLVCKMLEEALQGYQNEKWEFPSVQLPKNDRLSDSKGSPMSTKKSRTDKDQPRHTTGNKRGRKPTEKATDNRSAWRWSLDKRRLDPGKWSTDKLNPETKFVLGVNVNKALGHAANRGKVYILHPELFKYVCDGDDKTWLYDNKHMPVHGGKAFLMIFNEVESLTQSDHNYRENSDIFRSVQKLQRFSVPQFMLNKMKEFVRNVQGYFAQESLAQSNTSGSTDDK